jgi:hypothetical protein
MPEPEPDPEPKRWWGWRTSGGGINSLMQLTDAEALERLERGDRIAPLGGVLNLHRTLRAETEGDDPASSVLIQPPP